MPQPYLLHVNSRPTIITPETYQQWYLEEHIRDMVYFNATKTGAVYHSSSSCSHSENHATNETDQMDFLAIYQTAQPDCLDTPEFKNNVRQRSELWGKDLKVHLDDVCEYAAKEMKLVEVLGSYEFNEVAGSK
ncbi:hypothetical protein LTR09_002320 [Extremus antarcticus]|uniref:EthD domain-containing protein n=1 Tax=Extremus antarcticus TaxID=702011 RepID=A0AAJ0LV41_9PEZI|nr:hypothetical protein LTR09_002320 [Extremus antarcticus]